VSSNPDKPDPKGKLERAADPTPYDIEPVDQDAGVQGAGAPAASKPLKAQIDKPSLLADFDEDADFSEPSSASTKPGAVAPGTPPAPPPDWYFVREGLGRAQVIAAMAGCVTLAALLIVPFTHTSADEKKVLFWTLAWTLHGIVLQSLLGTFAAVCAAYLAEKPFGKLELAAARMLLGVSFAALILNLNLNPWAGVPLAFLAYGAMTFVFFRLARQYWFMMTAIHAIFWLLTYLK
jgi:hypothetical protein